MLGPAIVPAARPVRVKMPAPITTPMPNTVRSSAVRLFFSRYSGSSVSARDCSMLLVRRTLMIVLVDEVEVATGIARR